ncbi:MAG TPA: patatin family protein [Clostridia bacterium]|nr:patatin family protein [Clostridia bacterium]
MTGLIDVGGGMRGIYGAGVMDCFLERGIGFDYCIGVSSGSANVASFLSNQKGRNLRFYTLYARDKQYMSLHNWFKTRSYFGLDYIYQTLTNELDPIDYDVLLSTESKLKVVATNALDGKPHYFTNKDFQINNCEVLKASCALPAICRPVSVKDTLYFDGGVSDPVPIKKALADGCDKLVVILTRPVDLIKKREKTRNLYPFFLKQYPQIIKALAVRHSVYMDSIKQLLELEKAGKAVIISPTQKSSMTMATKRPDILRGFYKLGYEDAMKKIANAEI